MLRPPENLNELLGTTFQCRCTRTHTVSVDHIVFADDALQQLPGIIAPYSKGSKVTIIADQRTFAVAGRTAVEILAKNNWTTNEIILADTSHSGPVCDDITFEKLKSTTEPTDFFLAVGCGVINDLTKWLAFETGVPYAVIATAATMNGFTSANIAPAIKGVKSILHARAPVAVFAMPDTIANAPFELTAAGLGDVIAKPVSTADWSLNHIFCEEYYCPFCAELITALEHSYFQHPEMIAAKDPAALKAVFDALLYSGIAMTVVGTSAPASGGEHMLSHTLDMLSSVDNIPHDLHGRQVGLGTIFASGLYERILKIQVPQCHSIPQDVDESLWGRLTENVREQYSLKKPLMQTIAQKITDPEAWQKFIETAKQQTRPASRIKNCLRAANAAHTYKDIGCSRDRIHTAAVHMHEIRKRPTIIDLAWLLGIMPAAADEIIDEYLTT